MMSRSFLQEDCLSIPWMNRSAAGQGTARLMRDASKTGQNKRSSDRISRGLGVVPSKLKFCFFCMDSLESDEWGENCQNHLPASSKQYGSITYRNTLIRPAFCLLCIQLENLSPGERMQSWERHTDAIRHMEGSHSWPDSIASATALARTRRPATISTTSTVINFKESGSMEQLPS